MDVADILLIIQWRATCKLATLWQRFGRAVRDRNLAGTALLFAEKDYFDDERVAKEARRTQRERTRKRKAKDAGLPASSRPAKRGGCSSLSERAEISANDISAQRVPSYDGGNADEVGSSDEESDHAESPGPAVRSITLPENENLPQVDAPSTVGVEELLDAMKNTRPMTKQDVRSRKQRKRELDPGIDYLINAENRAGVMCRRKVFDVCFENSAASGNLPFVV